MADPNRSAMRRPISVPIPAPKALMASELDAAKRSTSVSVGTRIRPDDPSNVNFPRDRSIFSACAGSKVGSVMVPQSDDSSVGLCQYRVPVTDSVKSQPKEPDLAVTKPGRPLRQWQHWQRILLLGSLAPLAVSSPGHAQSLLFGPVAQRIKPKIERDPRLPSGSLRRDSLAVAPPADRACSLESPVCVATRSARFAARDSTLATALSALETAHRRLVYAAHLPAPNRHWEPTYGSPAVTWELSEKVAPLVVELLPLHAGAFESAAVLCRSGLADGDGEALERDAFLCVGEAIAARLDAAESPRSRRAYAEALWWELGQPATLDISDLAHANSLSHRSAVGRDDVAEAASTALFLEYLEQTLGTATPYGLPTGLFALSAQTRQPENPRYSNEPDWLDVLRESLGDDRADFAHRVNAFAAARAQLGNRDGPLGRLAWTGGFARITPDWVLATSSLPRRVANRRPIEPLGIVVVRIDIDLPTKDLSLAIHAEWEAPVPFAWTAVKLDAEDHEIGRIDLAFEARVTSAEKRIVALEGTKSLLVLGTNLGGVDAAHLLDPDHAPFEPHGCTLYVARL
jgi:hypothetical protein